MCHMINLNYQHQTCMQSGKKFAIIAFASEMFSFNIYMCVIDVMFCYINVHILLQ